MLIDLIKILLIYFVIKFILNQNILDSYIKSYFNIPKISIIIPIFNDENFLSECLNSVLNQSLKNIEIICIDDGSTDNSFQILKKYENLDKRLIIIRQKNQGSAIARNNGIKYSNGKFISFMDSDDLYPNKLTLEFMYKKAKMNKVVICGGGLRNFIQNNSKIKLLPSKNILFSQEGIIQYNNYQYDYFYQRFIYNKNFLKKNKLYFPNYLRYQDPPFFIKAMGLAKKFYALKNYTYFYRKSNKKIIWNEIKIIDVYRGLEDCLITCEKMNFNKLYCRILRHLNKSKILKLAKKFKNNLKLKETISKIFNNINKDIIYKENFSFIKNNFYNEMKL